MSATESPKPLEARGPATHLIVAGTFTAEPVEESLAFWMEALGIPAVIEFAPYNQIFQQLLDPMSLFAQNRRGLNVLLVRPEDWLRALPAAALSDEPTVRQALEQSATELLDGIRSFGARANVPMMVVLCPNSPPDRANRDRSTLLEAAVAQVTAGLEGVAGITVMGSRELAPYRVDSQFDPRRDRLGHIPYTREFFAGLGTAISRRVYAQVAAPHKVVVLDCDNTLWKGVVGEDGVEGLRIPPAFAALQRFMVQLVERGFVLCLCSKNSEADVMEVFERRQDMILRKEHLVSWRINWEPKSQNIRTLAQELNLGLDSFVFVDDNPVECAEVGLSCPEVLTLSLPPEDEIEAFLTHIWAFDRQRVTAEDRQRTAMYRQEAERARLQRETRSIGEFLSELRLQVTIAAPMEDQVGRTAQLTQRTNQFNFTTKRRNEVEVRGLREFGLECRTVLVADRFGDYGLVGVVIFGSSGDALEIDTFLLSCRVLGRGVEHRIMRELGGIARERGLARVVATVLFTKKNQPARDFLNAIGAPYAAEIEGGLRYELPVDLLAKLDYSPAAAPTGEAEDPVAPIADPAAGAARSERALNKSRLFEQITGEWTSASRILDQIRARAVTRTRAADAPIGIAPSNETEAALCEIWEDLLRVRPVGTDDDFFDLGGSSLLAVDLIASIERRFGAELPLTALIEAPTIQALARLLSGKGKRDSLVLIRAGEGRPPIFLVHDGDGETMLYRGLAMRLDPRHPVYGLQPHSLPGAPLAHTRIPEMAAHHIRRIRSVQPSGPYFLGGMCAGAVIAFEIACQLQALGERVALVGLMDAADPTAKLKAWQGTSRRLSRGLDVLKEEQSASAIRRLGTIVGKLSRKAVNLALYLIAQQLSRARNELRMQIYRRHLDNGKAPARFVGTPSVRMTYLFAERDYRPSRQFDGELLLFRATRGVGADEPYIARYEDGLLGWSPRATGGVRAIDVPGGHSSMLQEPHVETFAAHLRKELDSGLDGADSQTARERVAS
jgi:FkbH-like protein